MHHFWRAEDGQLRWAHLVLLLILAISGAQDLHAGDWVHGFQYLLMAAGLVALENGPARQQAGSFGRLRRAAGLGAFAAATVLLLYRINSAYLRG